MKKHLEFFGLDEKATESQLQSAYLKKRQDLEETIKEEGEYNEKLQEIEIELEEAKKEIVANFEERLETDIYFKIRREIKDHNFSEAQNLLDNIDERSAEWHYHQAMLYYEQGWTTEAKRKLLYTMSLDESNEKYKKAYENLVAKEMFSKPFEGESERKTKTERTYSPQSEGDAGERRRNSACCACQSLLCADCCCECMGGDLIPCCQR